MIYIYELIDPRDNSVRYVGRTINPKQRIKGHLSKSKSKKTHKDCWIQGMLDDGVSPEMNIIDRLSCSWDESHFIEKRYIKKYIHEGFSLTNHDDRGAGGKDKIISKEQKMKISKSVTKLHQNGELSCNRKPVDLYDLDANFIKSFNSMKECSNFLGVSEKHLQNYFKRGDKKIKNYIATRNYLKPSPWRYVERDNNCKTKIIHNGSLYNSIKEASEKTGFGRTTISNHINGKVKSPKFFKHQE